jgi:hypothetical protein
MKSISMALHFCYRTASWDGADDRSVVCLLLALQWGGTVYAWNSSRIIGLFVGFGLMITIFVIIQIKRGDKATLPLSVLRQRTVASAAFFLFFMGAALFVLIYYSTPYPHRQSNTSSNLLPSYKGEYTI